jgi:hypothetical protein
LSRDCSSDSRGRCVENTDAQARLGTDVYSGAEVSAFPVRIRVRLEWPVLGGRSHKPGISAIGAGSSSRAQSKPPLLLCLL